MKMGRRRFLRSLTLAGTIAVMGFSGCLSTPEPTPEPLPTPIPTSKPTPTLPPTTVPVIAGTGSNKKFTEYKQCPACSEYLYLQESRSGALMWVCENDECGYVERVSEPEILKKYGYIA